MKIRYQHFPVGDDDECQIIRASMTLPDAQVYCVTLTVPLWQIPVTRFGVWRFFRNQYKYIRDLMRTVRIRSRH